MVTSMERDNWQTLMVEPPAPEDRKRPASSSQRVSARSLEPMEIAAADLAQFAVLRVKLQELQESAKPYVELVEALFQSDPLAPEQIEMAKRKDFAKALTSLATAKVECDAFAEKAAKAWEMLKPVLTGTGTTKEKKSK